MTIAQQLQIKDFPFIIRNKDGRVIYHEDSNGSWSKSEYNSDGNEIYFENSHGDWHKREYDANGDITRYYENSDGVIVDNRQCPFSKAIVEVTLEDIAKKMGINVTQLRLKD